MGRSPLLLLLRNELRVTWRTLESGRRGRVRTRRRRVPMPVLILVLLLVIAVLAGVPAARALAGREIALSPPFVVLSAVALAAIFPLMLSQTLVAAVDGLYARGDLDLLLSSPVPPRQVLIVRALGMAVTAGTLFFLILVPFLIPMALWGHPELLSGFLIAIGMALLAAAVGLALAMLLFRVIGPRRTRTIAQVVGAFIGAAFVLGANLPNILGSDRAESLWSSLARRFIEGDTVTYPHIVEWPARAIVGHPLPLLGFLLLAVVVFAAVTWVIGGRFAEDSAAASGADTGRRRRRATGSGSFGANAFRAMIRKELRLLARDPGLLSHVLLRVLYLLPLAFIVLRNASDDQDLAVTMGAGALAFLSSQLAGSLAWITVSAEDAPALLAAAPMPAGQVWRAKLAASMIPLAAILVVPLIALVVLAPWAGIVAALGCAAASLSSGMLHIWLQKPGNRRDFQRRNSGALGLTLIDLAVGAVWALTTGLAAAGQLWFLLAAAAALVILWFARRPENAILERIGVG